ncbi:MAG: response regulator, partial [Chloroflexi bacterium]
HQVSQDKVATRIILMTGYDDVEQAIHAALAGAHGYCSKDIEPQNLSRIIREVAEGKYVFANNVFTRRASLSALEKIARLPSLWWKLKSLR